MHVLWELLGMAGVLAAGVGAIALVRFLLIGRPRRGTTPREDASTQQHQHEARSQLGGFGPQ